MAYQTVSASTLLALFGVFLERSLLRDYFVHLGGLLVRLQNDFTHSMMEYTEKHVFQWVKYDLNRAIDTQRPSLVVKAIHLVAVIANQLKELPEGWELLLADRLRHLMRAMSSHDNLYAMGSAYSEMTDYVRSLDIPSDATGIWYHLEQLQANLSSSYE